MRCEGTSHYSTIQCMATAMCSILDGTRASLSSMHHIVAELMVSHSHVKSILKHLSDVSVNEVVMH